MEEGEIRDDIDPDLIVEMLYAPVYLRLLFGHKPLTERYAEQAIAVAFAGVGTAAAVAG